MKFAIFALLFAATAVCVYAAPPLDAVEKTVGGVTDEAGDLAGGSGASGPVDTAVETATGVTDKLPGGDVANDALDSVSDAAGGVTGSLPLPL